MSRGGVAFVPALIKAGLFGATLLAAVPAGAQGAFPNLALTSGEVRTDPAGAFVTVSVKNSGTATVAEVVVSCAFTGKGGAKLGSSTTTIYSTVAGDTGRDQVRLMGAVSAEKVDCKIASTK